VSRFAKLREELPHLVCRKVRPLGCRLTIAGANSASGILLDELPFDGRLQDLAELAGNLPYTLPALPVPEFRRFILSFR
jgi:hypothetical protein